MSLTHSANNNCLFCVLTRPITYQNKLLLLYFSYSVFWPSSFLVLPNVFSPPTTVATVVGFQELGSRVLQGPTRSRDRSLGSQAFQSKIKIVIELRKRLFRASVNEQMMRFLPGLFLFVRLEPTEGN